MIEKVIIEKIRRRENGVYDWIYRNGKALRRSTLPRFPMLGRVLYTERAIRRSLWRWCRSQYCNQLMAYKCDSLGQGIDWDGDVPLIYGDGRICLGNYVKVGNRQTWVVGLKVYDDARLTVGDHTTINYQTLISVAKEVRIGKHCSLAGEIKIFDNNSHSTDYRARREKRPLERKDVAPVIIEDDVWVGTQTIILKGVRIGRGAVIAAGSVVTREVPPFTLVAGNPARVLRKLPNPHGQE